MEKSKELLEAEIEYTEMTIVSSQNNIKHLKNYQERMREKLRALGVTFNDEPKPCPFCGKDIEILVSDDEGNIHSPSYEEDPYSGLSYQFGHVYSDDNNCPIASFRGESIGTRLYDTKQDAINAWNNRA